MTRGHLGDCGWGAVGWDTAIGVGAGLSDCPAAAICHCLFNAFAIWYIVATSAEGRLGMRWLLGWSLGVGQG